MDNIIKNNHIKILNNILVKIMGADQSTINVAATLIVSDRRKQLSKSQLDYISTDQVKDFYYKNGDKIKKIACDIYGLELIKLIEEKRVSPLAPIVDEINRYGCGEYRASNIYEAIELMIQSKNVRYYEYYPKLVGYITFDSIIDAIIANDRQLYDNLKEPVARIPGERGILDPLRAPIKRSKILTLTNMNKKELGEYAIYVAFWMISVNPDSTSQRYLLYDIIEYVKQIGLLSKKDVALTVNKLADFMERGDLGIWYPSYFPPIEDFQTPSTTSENQKAVYQKIVKDLRERYPEPGFFG